MILNTNIYRGEVWRPAIKLLRRPLYSHHQVSSLLTSLRVTEVCVGVSSVTSRGSSDAGHRRSGPDAPELQLQFHVHLQSVHDMFMVLKELPATHRVAMDSA